MAKIKIITICEQAQARSERKNRPQINDWGVSWMVDTEADAFRIAYGHRDAPHGVKIDYCEGVDLYMVTVFNEIAKSAGIDGAK